MKRLRRWSNYGLTPSIMENCMPVVIKKNIDLLRIGSIFSCIGNALFSIFIIGVQGDLLMRGWYYLLMLASSVGFYFLARAYQSGICRPEKTAQAAVLAFCANIMLFALVMGVIWNPHFPATMFLIFFMGLSTVFWLRARVMFALLLVGMLAFCIASVIVKDASVYINDLLNMGVTFLMTVVMSWQMNHMRFSDITAKMHLLEQQELLEIQSNTDALTGLNNRHHAKLFMENLVNAPIKGNWCVAMLDVDDFKQVNDMLGHPAGDEVLKHVANILRRSLRRTDAVFRWGGEEFLIFLADVEEEIAAGILEKTRKHIANSPLDTGKHVLAFTVTAGVVAVDLTDLKGSIARCDERLYFGKQNGKNQVVCQ